MTLIEKWRLCLDRKGYASAMMTDLSRELDTVNHELLIATLHGYGFSKDSLEIILSYLSNRYQRLVIG